MLSVESQTVYDILGAITGDSEVFKIVEADEIIEQLPPAIELGKVQLSQIIRDLKERDYVIVKYFTPDEYCIRVLKRIEEPQLPLLPAYEPQAEQAQSVDTPAAEKESESKQKSEVKGVKKGMVFFMAFLGSFISSGIVAAATILIAKFALKM